MLPDTDPGKFQEEMRSMLCLGRALLPLGLSATCPSCSAALGSGLEKGFLLPMAKANASGEHDPWYGCAQGRVSGSRSAPRGCGCKLWTQSIVCGMWDFDSAVAQTILLIDLLPSILAFSSCQRDWWSLLQPQQCQPTNGGVGNLQAQAHLNVLLSHGMMDTRSSALPHHQQAAFYCLLMSEAFCTIQSTGEMWGLYLKEGGAQSQHKSHRMTNERTTQVGGAALGMHPIFLLGEGIPVQQPVNFNSLCSALSP